MTVTFSRRNLLLSAGSTAALAVTAPRLSLAQTRVDITRGTVQALTDPATWRASPVARADVAQFLVRELIERKFLRETPLLIA